MMIPASLFTDGVILSRRKEIRIFGEASRGAEVRARLHDPAGYLLAEGTGREKDGRFIVCLAPQEARTGCTLTLESGDEIRTVRDVAVGEVYLAGGQSNMELTLSGADEGPALIRQHHDPLLRFFNVPKKGRIPIRNRDFVLRVL
jgi:sialate O-acetylesterase